MELASLTESYFPFAVISHTSGFQVNSDAHRPSYLSLLAVLWVPLQCNRSVELTLANQHNVECDQFMGTGTYLILESLVYSHSLFTGNSLDFNP